MGVGRFFCVLLPFALTIGSIIFLLSAALAGVSDKSLYMFRLDVEDLSINPVNLNTIKEKIGLRDLGIDLDSRAVKTDNITAVDLNLKNFYDISLWGYCSTDSKNKRSCTKPKFDWANKSLDISDIESILETIGSKQKIPKEITDSLNAFKHASRWTQIVFIAAFATLAFEILFGALANFSRIFSCITWIVSGLSTVFVFAAAILSTAISSVVTGAVEGSAKYYGVRAKINTRFLAVVWIAAAFALASSLFWVFTICCCKPDHRSNKHSNRRSDGEKLLPTRSRGYAPLGSDNEMQTGYYNQDQSQHGNPRYPGGSRSDLTYEPFSHRA